MKRMTAIVLSIGFTATLVATCLLPHGALASKPDLTLFKRADKYVVTPGDRIAYAIYLNNPDPQIAPIVWINDTMPPGTTYLNDTAYLIYQLGQGFFVYKNLSGNVLSLKFAQVAQGNHSFALSVTVDNTVRDGDILTNVAAMNYTSSGGVYQPEIIATNSTLVATPLMILSKSATVNPADPTRVLFSFRISNAGSAEALHAWLNDSLPSGVNYVSFQAPPGVSCAALWPGSANCTRDHLPAKSSEIWNITASIGPSVPPNVPVTNWAFLDSTNLVGESLPQIQASATFTSRTAQVDVVKLADVRSARPGTSIHYSIFYNNTGSINARNVWINDTLPLGVSVVSTSIPPVYNASTQIRWYATNVSVGSHSLTMEVTLSPTLANGTLLTNDVTLDYVDAVGRKRPRSTDSEVTEVRFDIPSIHIAKTASVKTVEPGGQVAYAIYYNNTGQANAKTVTIEDIIPIGTQILASSPGYSSFSGSHYFWYLQDVPHGDHSISITLRVDIAVPNGTELWNTATVTYTDAFGQPVESNFQRVLVTVSTYVVPPQDNGDKNGESGILVLIALGGILAIAVVLGVVFYAMRRRGEAFIDDVFLLHKDGLLIKHFTRKLNPEVDSDILGGMLIAVQNFVNESFGSNRGLAKEGGLDELKFGQYSVLLARGRHVVLAAVARGRNTQATTGEIRATITDLENKLGPVLERWSGDMSQVEEADKYIQDLMAGKYKGKGKSLPKVGTKPAANTSGKMK